jgi:hypothetical protein
MNAPVFENLDLACARAGKGIAEKLSQTSQAGDAKNLKEIEKLMRDGLSVLEEQGVYAFFLFTGVKAQSKKIRKQTEIVSNELHEFLKNTPWQAHLLGGGNNLFDSLQELAENLDKLLLARDLLRQTLVYALYHVRLKKGEEECP